MEIRAIYSIPYLATAAGMTRWSMARLLRARGVTFLCMGRRRLVPLVELMARMPALWSSIFASAKEGGRVR